MPDCCGRSRPVRAGAIVLSLLLSCHFAFASGDGEPPYPLEAGVLQQHDMKADQSLAFSLPQGDEAFYVVEIDQNGLDLKVELRAPDGEAAVFNFPTGRDDSELLLVEPGPGGPPTLSVYSEEFTGAVAHPGILLRRIEATDELLPAYRLLSDSADAYSDFEWEVTLDKLEQACPLLEKPETTSLFARCQLGLATVLGWDEVDYDKGLEAVALAENAYRETGNRALAAAASFLHASFLIEKTGEIEKTPSQGIAPEAQALFDRSIELQQQALATQRELGNRFEAAFILNMIGYTYYTMGEYDKALEFYEPAAKELNALQEWEYEVWPLQNIGVINFDRGYLVRARDAFARNLELLPQDGAYANRQILLNNLAAAHLELGELDLALKSFSEALELTDRTSELSEKGNALEGIGTTYMRFGEVELGMDYLTRALPTLIESNDYRTYAGALEEIGSQHLREGHYQAALDAHKEAVSKAVMPRDRAESQLNLIEDLVYGGESDKALEVLAQAMTVAEDIESRILKAEVLKLYGDAWLSVSNHEAALEYYRGADTAFAELGLAIERSQALFGMSRSLSGLSENEQAVQYAIRAIETAEGHRAGISTPQLRALFMARRQAYYAHLVTTLVELQEDDPSNGSAYLKQALSFSERGHARSLVDLINEATQVDSGSARSEERENLLKELAAARFRLLGRTKDQQSESELEATRQQLADIENRLNLLEIEQREANPAYAELVDPTILEASEIQAMLDPESALLQYALGAEGSYVFMVTAESIEAWPLPGKARIEEQGRKIYEQLKVPSTSRNARNQLSSQIDEFARIVLPPAEKLEQQRLLIVADGVLQYLPFSVLLAANGGDESVSTLSRHAVVNVPSMSVLATQRENRGERGVPGKTIAIFADPVFSADDRRITVAAPGALNDGSALLSRQTLDLSEPPDLERLPATLYEAETIAGLVDPDSRIVQTGFAANRESVLSTSLDDYRAVHFATHGKIDSRYPALSWLAFSQVDPQGKEQNGLVRLHDIYSLELNADLVTMSACDTALGREISGEALTGLVQGFMYSGARSVLASLWQVPDRATAELMGLFYRNLFELEQKPAAALRNAQMDLSSKSRFRHPYYWSAFVLQGDWE